MTQDTAETSSTPDGGFFLETEAWRAALTAARSGLHDDHLGVLLEGESGAGKSLFLSRLAVGFDEPILVELRHPCGEKGLARRLREAGAPGGGAGLDDLLLSLPPGQFLGIDNVHHLSVFALATLLGRQHARREAGDTGLRLALTAPPGRVLHRLGSQPPLAAFRNRGFQAIRVPPLSEEESALYLRRSLEAAGRPPFQSQQVRALYHLAQGLPGQLDRVASDLLRGVRPRPYHRARAPEPRPGLARAGADWMMPLALGAMLVLLAGLGYRVLWMPPGEAVPEEDATLAERLSPPLDDPPEEPFLLLFDAGEEAAAPVLAPAAPPAPEASAPPATTGESWLAMQDPRHFTIQLASVPDEARAREFIRHHALSGRTVAVETLRGSFIVLHGSYPTQADLDRAVAGLPAGVRRNQPFGRRIESVRALVTRPG